MKLVIIIPAHNEEATIAEVIKDIPKQLEGIDVIEKVVVDDGSKDQTAQKAKKAGATVLSHRHQKGLAKTFVTGLEWALGRQADLIVNLDGDGQYQPREIPLIIKPILKYEADLVVGNRQIKKLDHMPLSKKVGNQLGTVVIKLLSGNNVSDASSGFRAFTPDLGRQLQILSSHTYTHEMIIQAAHKKFAIINVPITFSPRTSGESRLIDSFWGHIKKSGATILRTILMYQPFKAFLYLGGLIILSGSLLGARFLFFYLKGQGAGHIQSLLLATILIIIGFNTITMGFLADLISRNRQLIEKVLERK